jgi:hypothetical protein
MYIFSYFRVTYYFNKSEKSKSILGTLLSDYSVFVYKLLLCYYCSGISIYLLLSILEFNYFKSLKFPSNISDSSYNFFSLLIYFLTSTSTVSFIFSWVYYRIIRLMKSEERFFNKILLIKYNYLAKIY